MQLWERVTHRRPAEPEWHPPSEAIRVAQQADSDIERLARIRALKAQRDAARRHDHAG